MGSSIEFPRPDGKSCPSYLAMPSGGPDAPAVVVIQEWWGLNDSIRQTADRFATAGYRALVPDLYRGKLATSADEAKHLMASLDFGDAADQDLRGAIAHLKQYAGHKVAVVGFCMGGALTIIAGVRLEALDAAVCFYGIPPRPAADPVNIRVPFQAHFAKHDDWCTPSAVDEVEARLTEGKVDYELHRYDAHHGFMNAARAEVYDATAAELAWQRTFDFLKRTLS